MYFLLNMGMDFLGDLHPSVREAWRTMVKELAPQSAEGEYLRPKSQLRAQAPALVKGN